MTTVQHANFIQYGRRAGANKNTSKESSQEDEDFQVPKGMVLGDGTDLRQVTVLPQSEWVRIQEGLNSSKREQMRVQRIKEENEQRRMNSKNMVTEWSNTIAGQRQKKLQARKLREEREEVDKKRLDIEEAKYQAKKRQEAIEKAKTLQYFQTDRVKSFHGALMLTEVIKERDAQVELKRQKSAGERGKDKVLLKQYRLQYEQGIKDDQIKAKQRYDMRKKVADYQVMQAKEKEKTHNRLVENDKREGEELKKLAKLNEWEQQKLEDIRRDEKKKIMQAHKEHISNRDVIHALERQQEEEEDEEIRMFATAKKKMVQMRKQKEIELFKEVQDHKDRMTTILAAQLKQKVDDEDSRIKQAEKEREEKIDKETKVKEEKIKRDLKSIADHRFEQLSLKERLEKEHKKSEYELFEMKLEADRSFAEKQAEWRYHQKEKNKELQQFHVGQLNERAEKERRHREQDLEFDQKLVELVTIEEDQFNKYADNVIDDAKSRGCNLYPLVKAKHSGAGGGRGPNFEGKGGIKPSYPVSDATGVQLPKYQKASTEEIKSHYAAKDSVKAKKRLGFVW